MNALLIAFTDNLLPILLAAGVGMLLGKLTPIHPGSLAKVILYIFTPCLVFKLLTTNPPAGNEIATMMGFTTVLLLSVCALMGVMGRLLKWERSVIAAAMLASMATNAGNYGLSLVKFAFGESALPYAAIFLVANVLLTYTVGIAIASWGSSQPAHPLSAPLRFPMIYAFTLAMIFNLVHWSLPLPLDRVVTLFSEASIPSMLVLLGLQLSAVKWSRPSLALATSSCMRLLASPLVALGLSAVFALQGPAFQAGMIQSAMPTAVTATALASEFDLQPAFVTFSVVISTLLSVLTLTPLVALLV